MDESMDGWMDGCELIGETDRYSIFLKLEMIFL